MFNLDTLWSLVVALFDLFSAFGDLLCLLIGFSEETTAVYCFFQLFFKLFDSFVQIFNFAISPSTILFQRYYPFMHICPIRTTFFNWLFIKTFLLVPFFLHLFDQLLIVFFDFIDYAIRRCELLIFGFQCFLQLHNFVL